MPSVSRARPFASLVLSTLLLAFGCAGERSSPARTVGCQGCTILRGGQVFDGTRAGRGVVVLRGDRVEEVAFGDVEIGEGDVVDVTGKTVLPGLIDLHVHSESGAGPYGSESEWGRTDDAFRALLRSGVTTALDLGSSSHVIFPARRALGEGTITGPRLLAAGPLFTPTGGHPCYDAPPGDFCVFIDSPADVASAFPSLVRERPDLVKIVFEPGAVRPIPRMKESVAVALERAAEAADLRVIAHVATARDVEDALDAGIRLFAHLPIEDRVSPGLARRMAEAEVTVVPTLGVLDSFYRIAHGTFDEVRDPGLADDVPAEVIAALRDPDQLSSMTSPHYQALTERWRDDVMASFKACREAGVAMVAGTDAGNPGVFHGLGLAKEIALFIRGGMTPTEALIAGTGGAADMLRRPDLGRLQRGAAADLLVVDGDPLADPAALGRVSRVYQRGALVDRAALSLRGR